MPEQWEDKQLADVCNIEKVQGLHRKLPYVGLEDIGSATAEFLGSMNPRQVKSSTFQFTNEHILYGRLRPYLNKVLAPEFKGHCSTEIFPIKPKPILLREYLLYWLLKDSTVDAINATCTGTRMPRANMKEVMRFDFCLPPLPEQKRIVAILDEAFAGISQAVANAEKNLTNARELFESYLNSVFTQKGEGWVEKTLGDTCDLFQGLAINKGTKHLLVKDSSLPLLRIKDLRNGTQEQYVSEEGFPPNAQVTEEDILYTRTGQIGLVFRGRYGVLHNNCFKIVPRKGLLRGYLFWWLQDVNFKKEIVRLASRAAQPDITHTLFKSQTIIIPPIEHQKSMAHAIEAMYVYTQQLESIYQQKLNALNELKQSILQKAFSGELADSRTTPLKLVEVETASPEFTANVLAFAYYQHALRERDRTFGHVKAQKTLQLAESIGGIDLGRDPIKDAAGPNDFDHMLRAEDWAKANKLFEFLPAEKGYEFKKFSRYNVISKTFSAIKPYRKTLEKIIDLLIPMNTKEAEVFATVLAAWNELVFKGDDFDDSKIIYEARDNWHPDKMKIPISKFRKAIRFIRDNKLVPDGKAKRLSGQEQMF